MKHFAVPFSGNLSLIFYLILTCPFQRVRFLFLFSLWNINLAFVVKELIRKNDEKLEKNVLKKSSFDHYKRLISEIFNFVRENERLIHSLGNSGHFIFILDALSQQITFSLKEKIEEDRRTGGFDLPASPDIMASFFVGAIGENVRNWVANGKKIPGQELKDQLCNLIKIIYSSANPNF